MKQNMFLPVLTALVVFYNFLYLPMQISVLSLLAAFALYGLTNNLVVSMIILVATPLLVLTTRLYKQNMDGFANAEHSAASVSERVKEIKKASHTEAKVPSGTLESPEIENFQNISSEEKAPVDTGSAVSVPAYVKEKGRMLVIPEQAVPKMDSVERDPKANPVVAVHDADSIQTALSSESARPLQGADSVPSQQVGPMPV
uniref:Uncharacterized protein n=1 Tax=viral metagenome TaxID=1070528 RepID=A0A6C0BAP0_9ZZZZ